MRRPHALFALALAGCGFDWDGFDPRLGATVAQSSGEGSTTGAGGSGATVGTGGVGGESGPFGRPQVVAALSHPADDDDPSMTSDGLELYFNSDRSGNLQIWLSMRATRQDDWQPPTEVAELNTTFNETAPSVAPDGLSMWFGSNRDMTSTDIYVATRRARSDPWSMPMPVPALNSTASDIPGGVTSDNRTIVFESSRAATTDLYIATRASVNDPWSEPVALRSVNGPAVDAEAWLSEDGLLLYFASDGARPDIDMYVASRASPTGTFGTPTPVSELNAPGYQGDPILSPDLQTILFSAGAFGARDIHQATR